MLNKVLDWDGVGIRRWEWARVSCRWTPRGGTGGTPVLRLRGLGAGVVPVPAHAGGTPNEVRQASRLRRPIIQGEAGCRSYVFGVWARVWCRCRPIQGEAGCRYHSRKALKDS